jgi:hypothetical protein
MLAIGRERAYDKATIGSTRQSTWRLKGHAIQTNNF